MISLFSSYDLVRLKFLLISLVVIFKIFILLWFNRSTISFFKYFFDFYNSSFSSVKNFFIKFSYILHFCLILIISRLNYLAIFCYNLCFTSQISLCFFISSTFLFSFWVLQFVKNFKGGIKHFTPEGTPWYIVIFIVLIEIVRIIIRPLTLSLRLRANVIAGHCIMGFISSMARNILEVPSLVLIGYFEFYIAILQAHIFGFLMYMYYSEIN